MRLGGLEQPPDRVARPCCGIERAGVATQARVPVDRLRAGDRQQLPASFVQLDPQAEEGLKAPAEAAARAPHPLCDRAHPPAVRCVQMQDAIRLAVAHRSQNHRLRLHRSALHATYADLCA